MPGTLFVVATPIGNLDDITLRALRVLREATLIAAEDTRRTAHLLARHGINTPTTSLHEHNENRKASALVDRLLAGDTIALVSDAGTPGISDPGSIVIRRAIDAGVRVEPIPGPNAAIAALSVAGISTESFVFLGFPPTRSKDRSMWFSRLAEIGGIAIFFEAPHRIVRTLRDLEGRIGDRPVLVAREVTKVHEELVRGPISEVITRLEAPRGEFTVLVDVGSPERHATEIGHKTEYQPTSTRASVSHLAREMGISANDLYRAVTELQEIGQKTDKKP